MSNDEPLRGCQPERVINVLCRRRDVGYRAGSYADSNKVALVIEGGALRGVVSSGAASALHQLGFGTVFDSVYGTSSGALNAAYFVSGQITYGTTIYYENATDPQFVKLLRWPDQLDIEWLIDNWIAAGKPVDLDAVMESPTDLYISMTDTGNGALRFISNRTDGQEWIIPALRASCSTPLFVTRWEEIDGRKYNDGMLRAAIPVQHALDDGCTHIVALLTRPYGYRKRFSPWIAMLEHMLRIQRYPEDYQAVYHSRAAFYNDALDAIYQPPEGVCTLAIQPKFADEVVSNAETRPEPLRRAAKAALVRTARTFSIDACNVALHEEM